METDSVQNALLSKNKNSDSRLQVQLHPLVLLNISDHITRHILRRQQGPVVGAILGSQNGREITMEHAFECKVDPGSSPEEILLDAAWFYDRLQSYKEVHKAPALDFVGWFTLAPPSGPQPAHLPIHQQLLETYNESALLLTFHPSSVADDTSKGGKLPLAIYETVYEAAEDDDAHMQSSGGAAPQLSIRFQELPYTIETGEAEMIGVDFVASGGANASASAAAPAQKPEAQTAKGKDKGKGKATADQDTHSNGAVIAADKPLSAGDEELIASLTAKANAIRMLQQRIRLIKSYLASRPPCYLYTPPSADAPPTHTHPDPEISYPILRQISSMLARLPLLAPPDIATGTTSQTNGSMASATATSPRRLEQQNQQTDTLLVSLLSSMGSTLQSATQLGKKVYVFESARNLNMTQNQRRLMEQMRAGDDPGSGDGFDDGGGGGGGGGGERGPNGAPWGATRGGDASQDDVAVGDEGRFDEDDDDEEDDGVEPALAHEEWEVMDQSP